MRNNKTKKRFARFASKSVLKKENENIFDLLNKANKQYNTYLKLRDVSFSNLEKDNDILKRDMSHPLNIVLNR